MSTLADQIRELQKKLEKITEAPGDAANSYAGQAQDDATGVDAAVAAQAAQTTQPVATQPAPTGSPVIDAPTFSQAYAIAKRQGLKKFKWCGEYAVKDPVKTQPKPGYSAPAPAPTRQFNPNVGGGANTGSLEPVAGSDLPIAP